MPRLIPSGTRRRAHNSIVTRGMGRHQNLVRQGFIRGFFEEITYRVVGAGRSGYRWFKDELTRILVWAKLIEVNDAAPTERIEGSTSISEPAGKHYGVVTAEVVSKRVVDPAERIKVTVQRVK